MRGRTDRGFMVRGMTFPGFRARLPAIQVHGGAGWRRKRGERAMAGCQAAAMAAWDILKRGGAAVDAVEAAVVVLEDDPLFNAGTGSVLNADGRVEMDAAIMDGARMRAGAVAAVRRIRNPVTLARRILEDGRHLLMVGEGAARYAKLLGVPRCSEASLIVAQQLHRWRAAVGTVGAVAVDFHGRVAAATSTGGTFGKMPGRVGDTPLIGCGTYADSAGAASCTGAGEAIIRVVMAKAAVDMLHGRTGSRSAARRAVALLQRVPGGRGGVIVADSHGRLGFAHNTESMPVCLVSGMRGRPVSAS
ncbi:MAG: isoaspartyl peptidase/L-asparaginase family protein [Gammaproteobacteria bacterium]|nr:isoaspartyl peptidase/L-asparaginase family protein [Gammaproteobacteria bacterium]